MSFLHVLWVTLLNTLAGLVFGAHVVLGVFLGTSGLISTPTSTPLVQSPAISSTTPLSSAPSDQATSSPTSSPTISIPNTPETPLPAPANPPSVPQAPSITQNQADVQTRAALVNILCTTSASGYFNPLSGSGVIVDARGVILTNAHVGQYFLLHDYPTPGNVQCIVRTGNPATPAYTAQLLYLPPVWVAANASQIGQHGAQGTGENDYAFLLITGSLGNTPLPATFPHLTMTTSESYTGEPALLAAYPAEFLGGTTIQKDLYISSAVTQVSNLFTFAPVITSTTTVDSISVGGTIVSQEGSSGGPVVRLQDGALMGLITTESTATTTAGRDLRAITLEHIDYSLAAQGQGSIATLLTGDLSSKLADFSANFAPQETAALAAVLDKR